MPVALPATTFRVPDGLVHAVPSVDGRALAERVRAELARLDPGAGETALASGLTGLGEVLRWRPHRATFLLREGPLGAVHVKVYRPKNGLDRVLGSLFPSRGLTSWRMAAEIRAAGLPTPDPVLLMQCRPAGQSPWTVLLSRPLEPPVVSMTDELRRLRDAGASARPVLREIARLVARFHDAGFFHGDLTANNVLLSGPERTLWLIDLDRAKSLRSVPAPARLAVQIIDLRMLLLSSWREVPRPAWMRMLAEYLRARRIGGRRRKRVAARVLAARRGRLRLGARPRTGTRTPWT